jgi:hypothetical protein
VEASHRELAVDSREGRDGKGNRLGVQRISLDSGGS